MQKTEHEHDVKKLQEEVRKATTPLTLAKTALHSNTTRSSDYKRNNHKLPVDTLNRVLEIDEKRLIARCEPGVSMVQLATECYKHGLVPRVVPEFKGITVGGAIMGCGGESSSLHVGLFHDTCECLELLLGDGSVVTASEMEHTDLYDAVPGSYGSLALLLRADIRLQSAKPWVTVNVHRVPSGKEALRKMEDFMHQKAPPEYLEGIVFSEDHAVLLEANQHNVPTAPILKDGRLSPWYYQFVKEQESRFSMPLLDYLFRYDRGAFWMGAYVLKPSFMKKLLSEGVWKVQKPKPLTYEERKRFSKIQSPNVLVRAMSYDYISSQPLFALLHTCEDWVAARMFVQDFTLPVDSASDFFEDLTTLCTLYPIWLCPVKAQRRTQCFAPHSLNGSDSINIGVYGIPDGPEPLEDILRKLERKLFERGGRKWLYTHSCYSPEQFWNIYPHAQYNDLRQKYHAAGRFVSIEKKILK